MNIWDNLSTLEKCAAAVVIMGSVVDIVQFSWIVKKSYQAMKARMYDKIKKELLLEKHDGVAFGWELVSMSRLIGLRG